MAVLRKMHADEFARRLRADSDVPDKRFVFFLGAGCSISSGIPGAGSLVKERWLPQLRDLVAPNRADLDAWAKEQFPAYDKNDPAVIYGAAMERRFLNPEDRQREIENLCDSKFPFFGYAVLASLMVRQGGAFNVVVTTNFDDLVSDALYLFTTSRPLVIGHESLAAFIRPTRTRPLVVKLHGDAHLVPLNTEAETLKLRELVEKQVQGLLHDRGLIFMGYGGNDHGIAQMLMALRDDALPLGVYWIGAREAKSPLRKWLEERKATWVERGDFDEMMLLIREVFALEHPDENRLRRAFEDYAETYKKLSELILSSPAKASDVGLRSALDAAQKGLPEWIAAYLQALALEKTEPEKAEQMYKRGVLQFPTSAPLLGAYANFLTDIRKDHDKAEQYYQRALEADPKNANNLGNYAVFLKNIRKDHDKAEQYYQRALEADPKNANHLGNYAGFLLARGRTQEGLQALDHGIQLLSTRHAESLDAELWFYAFAHGRQEERPRALRELKQVLVRGVRSPGWDLSMNVARAREDGHPDIQWIEVLADVITKDADIKKLDTWRSWREA